MTGAILQINTSLGGIPKRAIREGFLTPTGIEGDLHAHPQIHGGPRQAVLLIASEVIDELRAAGYPVYPGALGENLTTRGIDFSRLRSGQRFRVGQAIIELTKVRGPCKTLDVYNSPGLTIQEAIFDKQVKAGDATSPLWAKSGFYASVERTGRIGADDIITLLDHVV
jgi:MOSC domain-containing protein YiiM